MSKKKSVENVGRREIMKALGTIPILGVFFYKLFKKHAFDSIREAAAMSELGELKKAPAVITSKDPGKLLRLGIIGYGGRGHALLRALGFTTPVWTDDAKQRARENKMDKGYESFINQTDLNVVLNGVCDIYDTRAEEALAASTNDDRPGSGTRKLSTAKRYRHYQDLLEAKDIDAVIIATPDHWHAQMIMDAVQAGKHVYCEKCMTRTIDEAFDVYDVVKDGNVKFQLGHQNRQIETHMKAKEIVDKGILGPITLIESTTNRNDPGGAWQYTIHEDGTSQTIDWEQFQAQAPTKMDFNAERFFRWRKWFDYGTGLAGDLLSHEYDAVNQIMDLGIPKTAVASGGVYFYKDGRDVPDVFQVVYEYPDRNLTYMYSATLANGKSRGRTFMGHDAHMEVGRGLTVTPESNSTRYKDKMDDGSISSSLPLFSYTTGSKEIDGITSATSKYFAKKGLVYTYREGKRFNTSHLHMKEWIDTIRNGTETSCNIEKGFEEAITCHMATESYRQKRVVEWNPVKRQIV
jgi:predicted dehydrogenase